MSFADDVETQPIEEDKYLVFKRADLATRMAFGIPTELMDQALDDAVVIRKQDVFAGPGLFAYASCIQTALDIGGLAPSVSARLEQLRDWFWQQATDAVGNPRKKLPD